MLQQMETNRIFSLDIDFKDPLQNKLFSMVKSPIEHFLAFPRLNRAYADISLMKDSRPFPDKVLEQLNVTYDLGEEGLARMQVPAGPVIVVANHPFGGIEGIILASVLRSLRCDVKFMANSLLNCIPEMRDLLIAVNPFKQDTAVREISNRSGNASSGYATAACSSSSPPERFRILTCRKAPSPILHGVRRSRASSVRPARRCSRCSFKERTAPRSTWRGWFTHSCVPPCCPMSC